MNKKIDDTERLLRILDATNSNDKTGWLGDVIPFFNGIINGEKDVVLKSVKKLCENRVHRRLNQYNHHIADLVTHPASGLAKIAWINGFELEFNEKLIPTEMLPYKPNCKFKDEISPLIQAMTLKSEYLFYGGIKVKKKSDVFDVFVFSSEELHGKNCVKEILIPDIFGNTRNFIGVNSGKLYQKGMLHGTNIKTSQKDLLDKVASNRTVSIWKRWKSKRILNNYLNQIDELSKRFRGIVLTLDRHNNLITEPNKPNKIQRKDITKWKKEYFLELGKELLSNSDLKTFKSIILNLKDYDDGSDYDFCTTLGFLINRLHEEGILLFGSLDWKFDLYHLEEIVNTILVKNLKMDKIHSLDLDSVKKVSASNEEIIRNTSKELKKLGLCMHMVDSGADQYIFLISTSMKSSKIENILIKLNLKKQNWL